MREKETQKKRQIESVRERSDKRPNNHNNQILPGRCENVHPHRNTKPCVMRGPISRLVWSVGNVRRCRYLSKIAATPPILRIQNVSHFVVSRIHFKDPSAKNEWPQVVVFVFVLFTPFFPENLRGEGTVLTQKEKEEEKFGKLV